MIEIKDFRKLKIVFKKEDGSFLTIEDVDKLINSTIDWRSIWFLRGIKHILENHYTEAIKRFQLVDSPDADLLILMCSYKLQDSFILNEYKDKKTEGGEFFKYLKVSPYFYYEGEIVKKSQLLKML